VLGHGRGARRATVPVTDCEPGAECQVDFGRMGLLDDPQAGRRRVVHALIFTAVYSRHCFVWLSFRQDLAAVIAGCEAAWAFFGGVFAVIIPDNMAAIVDKAHPTEPRLNRAFAEYAQDRGFVVDPARIRRPQDKGLVSHCTSWAGLDTKGRPGGFAGGPIVARRAGCGHVSRASSGPTRSATATGSSQCGQHPPMPTRRVKAPQSSQRWLGERVEQLSHS